MTTTAPSPTRLAELNRRYLALRREINQAKARFCYPADAIWQAQELRNEIIELQNQLSSERRSEVMSEHG